MTDKYTNRLFNQALGLLREALEPRMSVEAVKEQHSATDAFWIEISRRDAIEREPLIRLNLQAARALPGDSPTSPHQILVVEHTDNALRAKMRSHGENFVDLGRREVHLSSDSLLVDRRLPRPAPARSAPTGDTLVVRKTSPFSPGPSRVTRLLLLDALSSSPSAWGVRDLADAAHVDRTTTSHVLRQLDDWGLVQRNRAVGRRGRALDVRIREPIALLDRWSASYDWTRNARLAVHAPVGDPERFIERFAKALPDVRWALTLQAGASRLAPHASWDRLHVYVQTHSAVELKSIAAAADWTPGEEGRVVLLQAYYGRGLWDGVRQMHHAPIVDFAQLLLDLWRYPVRGREQAEHLLAIRHMLPSSLFERTLQSNTSDA
jgi:hypothetical protein